MPRRSVALDVFQQWEYVAPGQMGSIRQPMLKMETLHRPQLGKPLTRGRPKQSKGFTYGMKYPIDPNAMAKCLNWPIHEPTKISDFPRDFHKTNVESAKAGIHPVPVWEKFANEKDFKLDSTKARLKKPVFPKGMIFGRPPRPSTPINCVLTHQYKTEFDQSAIARNKKYLMKLAVTQNAVPQPYDTIKSVVEMHPLSLPQKSGPLWKISRFLKEPARIRTHWSKQEEKSLMAKMYEDPVCDVPIYK